MDIFIGLIIGLCIGLIIGLILIIKWLKNIFGPYNWW